MALVKFNENVDLYVKGDIMELSDDELKHVDTYAKTNGIEKPYSKVEKAKAEKPADKPAEK